MAATLKPLNEQVIVITGASSGIGLATTVVAAASGAKLVLAARSEETLRHLASDIRAKGGQATYQAGDVGKLSDVRRIADKAIARFGRIDTWINVAGVAIYGRLTQSSDEDNRRLFDTNFWGTVYGSKVALPHLEASRGALINIGHAASAVDGLQQGMHVVSKAAVKGFTEELRAELERDQVPVSVRLIEPGATDTPLALHARNYTARKPTLPILLNDPIHVAETILEAATDDKHSIKRGVPQIELPIADEAPRNPDGALHRPSGSGKIFGGGRFGLLASLAYPN